jgi:hypothetical protein
MIRARYLLAATVTSASLIGASVIAQTPPPMTSVLAGKKFTPPAMGPVEVDFTAPKTARVKDMVVTKIMVKNTMTKPIARLTIDETWYDKSGATVTGSKGIVNGLLQPGEVQTIVIETPFNPKMSANNYNFTHANGSVKPHKVTKIDGPADAAPAAKTKTKK